MVRRFTRFVLFAQLAAAIAIALALHRWATIGAATSGLASLASLAFFRVFIVANNFLLSWYFGSETPPEHKLNCVPACRMFLDEFAASMAMWFWYMPFGKFTPQAFADAPCPPVLLVAGYGCNRGYWIPFSRRLRRLRISHRALDLEPMFCGIDDYVPAIGLAIERYCRELGQEKIMIVAHSMGGIAARAYLRKHGAMHVAKIVTIGTPHHGTCLARFGKGVNSAQMRRYGGAADGTSSEWLRRLAAEETQEDAELFVNIYSHQDNIISPQTSSCLPGSRNIALHGVGHVALGTDPKVQDKIIEEILHFEKPSSSQAI